MNIALWMARGVELMEASAFIDVFRWHQRCVGGDIELHTVGATHEVTSSSGVVLRVNRLLAEVRVDDYAALAVPGVYEPHGSAEDVDNAPALELIRAFAAAEKPIAAVSMGALALARAGVLRGRRATTYHVQGSQRMKELTALGADVVLEPVVLDRRIVTSWCPSTAIDVAFSLLSMIAGPPAALAVRALMGY